jgi:hypothetical protein
VRKQIHLQQCKETINSAPEAIESAPEAINCAPEAHGNGNRQLVKRLKHDDSATKTQGIIILYFPIDIDD